MLSQIKKIFRYCKARGINFLLLFLGKNIDKKSLLRFAYSVNGIGNFGDKEVTGEEYVIKEVLKRHLGKEAPVFFDIGANVGGYANLLINIFPEAAIYCFEPNAKAFAELEGMAEKHGIRAYNMGMGASTGVNILYSYSSVKNSTLGTCNETALKNLFGEEVQDEIEKTEFKMDTIDNFCIKSQLTRIDFLKIDVEGYEKEVLKGAYDMIREKKIKIIQFEFNIFNLEYGVRLKDFYELLDGYELFRVKKGELIPLGGYEVANEIFQYQNILAIAK